MFPTVWVKSNITIRLILALLLGVLDPLKDFLHD